MLLLYIWTFAEITNEILDGYIVEELFSYWEKLGKALHLEETYLQEIYDEYPMNPAMRLRMILRKWRDTTERPSLASLDRILGQLGVGNSVLRNRGSINGKGIVCVCVCVCVLCVCSSHSSLRNLSNFHD